MMEKKSRTKKRTTGCNDELEPLVARMGVVWMEEKKLMARRTLWGKNGEKTIEHCELLSDSLQFWRWPALLCV